MNITGLQVKLAPWFLLKSTQSSPSSLFHRDTLEISEGFTGWAVHPCQSAVEHALGAQCHSVIVRHWRWEGWRRVNCPRAPVSQE